MKVISPSPPAPSWDRCCSSEHPSSQALRSHGSLYQAPQLFMLFPTASVPEIPALRAKGMILVPTTATLAPWWLSPPRRPPCILPKGQPLCRDGRGPVQPLQEDVVAVCILSNPAAPAGNRGKGIRRGPPSTLCSVHQDKGPVSPSAAFNNPARNLCRANKSVQDKQKHIQMGWGREGTACLHQEQGRCCSTHSCHGDPSPTWTNHDTGAVSAPCITPD